MTDIRNLIPQFKEFSNTNIIDYCMILNDLRIQIHISTYVKNIMKIYKDETEGTIQITNMPVTTRTGRLVKKPIKLNL